MVIHPLKKIFPNSFKKSIKLILHSGTKFTCPLCKYSAKDMLPIGLEIPVLKEKEIVGASRRFAGCLNCNSTDKERLVYLYLKEKLKIFQHKHIRILHIAPEQNLSKKLLQVGFDSYVCGDLFTEGYSYPEYVRKINILNIPFDENVFDLIICNHVLEHIQEDISAMRELYRVLKIGGQAIVQVPISKILEKTYDDTSLTSPTQREAVFGQFDHVRIYGQDYSRRLQEGGFSVTKINISEEFSQYGLNKDEDIYIGTKQ
jgi:SAM-dependent methyltransferase